MGSCAQSQVLVPSAADAASELHLDISLCIAYFEMIRSCVPKEVERQAEDQIGPVLKNLYQLSYQTGTAAGLTEDAMKSRILMAVERHKEDIAHSCVNLSSLYMKHGAHCKRVMSKPADLLLDYLKK